MEDSIVAVRDWLTGLQQRITTTCAGIDGQPFRADAWKKEPGEPLQGDGVTMILEGGQVFERAGMLTAVVVPDEEEVLKRGALREAAAVREELERVLKTEAKWYDLVSVQARHIGAHPGDPFGFSAVWFPYRTPGWMLAQNPPGFQQV